MPPQNPERLLVEELRAAVLGKPLPSTAYQTVGDLANSLTSGGSANWPPLGWAVRYILKDADAPDQWRNFFSTSMAKGFMGDEEFSAIYWALHLAAVLAVGGSARERGDSDLASSSLGWLTYWFGVCVLCEAPDGHVILPGLRSAGHPPDPGIKEWVLAIARGDDAQRRRWEDVARQEKLGLKVQWAWLVDVCNALTDTLHRAFAPLTGKPPEEIPPLLPPYRLDVPLTVFRTAHGVAAYLTRSDNPNTAAWLAGSWIDGQESWGPKNGGVSAGRFREHGDDATVGREGTVLHYASSHFGSADVELPPGPAFEVTLGTGGTAPPPGPPTPVPPTPVPPTPIPPTPDLPSLEPSNPVPSNPVPSTPVPPSSLSPPLGTGRTAAAIAADVQTLAVPRKQLGLRDRLVEEMRQLPAGRPPGQIAADLGTLGISQGQQDLWHRLQEEVKGFTNPG